MKLLIIGGGVFLGRHLVEAGLRGGHQITVFNRGRHNEGLPSEVERLFGDRQGDLDALGDQEELGALGDQPVDLDALDARHVDLGALGGRRWDTAIDTCGFFPSVVRGSATRLAKAVGTYIFVSSCSVYPEFRAPGLDESAAVGTLTEEELRRAESEAAEKGVTVVNRQLYGPLKALCERAAEECLPGRVLNVRPGLIVGPRDRTGRFSYWPRRVSRGGEVLAPGRPERPVQFIDVRDLAEWIIRMAERQSTGTFNATGPDRVLTMQRFLDEARAATGSDARFVWVDEAFLLASDVTPWTEIPLWVPEATEAMKFFLSVDCGKAFAAGLTCRPLAETVLDTLAWDTAREGSAGLRDDVRDQSDGVGLAPEKERDLLERWRRTEGAR